MPAALRAMYAVSHALDGHDAALHLQHLPAWMCGSNCWLMLRLLGLCGRLCLSNGCPGVHAAC